MKTAGVVSGVLICELSVDGHQQGWLIIWISREFYKMCLGTNLQGMRGEELIDHLVSSISQELPHEHCPPLDLPESTQAMPFGDWGVRKAGQSTVGYAAHQPYIRVKLALAKFGVQVDLTVRYKIVWQLYDNTTAAYRTQPHFMVAQQWLQKSWKWSQEGASCFALIFSEY